MLHTLTMTALGAAASIAPVQQTAQEVVATMRERQLARWETVDNYTVVQKVEGLAFPIMPGVTESGELEVPMHYQKHEIDGRVAFGIVDPNEYQVAVGQASEHGAIMDADALAQAADANRMMGEAWDQEMAKSGMPMLPGMDQPGQMFRDNAMFYDATSEAVAEAEAGDFGRGNAAATLAAHDEMVERMRLVGREEVEGREAFHLRAEGLNRVLSEPGEEGTFTLRAANVWIDTEHYVLLRTTMEGELEAEGETREVTLEQDYQDYREAGPLYESHRQVMRMTGMMGGMDPEQREELEEARRQMEEMEAQLDQMPAAARGMVESQMEKARAQMAMLENDGFEMATQVLRIEINTGPPPPGTRGAAAVEDSVPADTARAEGPPFD